MALTCRRIATTCVLLALCFYRQCSGFLGSAPLCSASAGTKFRYSSSRGALRKHDPAHGECLSALSSSSRGIRMVAAPAELWDSYLHALEAAPLLTKSITAGCIFPAADATAQLYDTKAKEGEHQQWDGARTLRWLFFGFAVQAPWNHFFYVFLDGALPPTPDPLSTTTAVKVLIDQFVQAPIFTIVIFGVLGLLEGKTVEDIREQLDQDYKSTMLANWGVFVPAAVVNLAFCPPELRVLFLNVVFFGWTIFLSTVVSKGGGEAAGEA
ncbi:unnamed protein product [Pylaiella littoralis]